MPASSHLWSYSDSAPQELLPGEFKLIQTNDGDESTTVILNPIPSEDPNDPLNWSMKRKAANYALALGATLGFWTCFSLQTNFWQQMSTDMGLSFAQLNNAQSGGGIGLAIGCILIIPFTKKYGRRSTYVLSNVVLAAVAWWSAKMTTLAEVYVTNLLCGLAGASNETIIQMTISDLFFAHQRGRANSLNVAASLLGCFLTPLLAGIQAVGQGWRSSYIALAISLTVLAVMFIFGCEETKYIRIPAEEKALQDSDVDSDSHDTDTDGTDSEIKDEVGVKHVDSDISTNDRPIPPNSYTQRLRWLTPTSESLPALFTFPFRVVPLPYVIFSSLLYGTNIFWLISSGATSSMAFSMPPYNFNTAQLGYLSIAPLVGSLVGSCYSGLVGDWAIKALARRNGGIFHPEFRLYPLLPPVMAVSGGLILFGITLDKGMHWIYPSIGAAVFCFGAGAVGEAVFTILIDVYQPVLADAFVVVSFFQNAGAAGMMFAIPPWMQSFGLTKMFITMGIIALVIGMSFLPLIYWGRSIRKANLGYYKAIVKVHDAI